jgi:hypothetical protein
MLVLRVVRTCRYSVRTVLEHRAADRHILEDAESTGVGQPALMDSCAVSGVAAPETAFLFVS